MAIKLQRNSVIDRNYLIHEDAVKMANLYVELLGKAKVQFSLRFIPDKKQFQFTAIKDADLVKAQFPIFDISHDNRQQRIAVLTISYE